jgi:hypothetical protein
VGVDGRGAVNHQTCLVVAIKRLPHEVDMFSEEMAKALPGHEVVQQSRRASKGPGVEAFIHDVPRGSGAVGKGWEDTLHCLLSALICASCMKEHCVGAVLRLLIQPHARFADSQLWDEVRCLE